MIGNMYFKVVRNIIARNTCYRLWQVFYIQCNMKYIASKESVWFATLLSFMGWKPSRGCCPLKGQWFLIQSSRTLLLINNEFVRRRGRALGREARLVPALAPASAYQHVLCQRVMLFSEPWLQQMKQKGKLVNVVKLRLRFININTDFRI